MCTQNKTHQVDGPYWPLYTCTCNYQQKGEMATKYKCILSNAVNPKKKFEKQYETPTDTSPHQKRHCVDFKIASFIASFIVSRCHQVQLI